MGTRAIVTTILAGAVVLRVVLAPREAPPVTIRIDAAERLRLQAVFASSLRNRADVVQELAAKRILLVGESHFVQEPQTWVWDLIRDLNAKDGRKTVLVLELPERGQGDLDRYRETGDDRALGSAFGWGALPYQGLVRAARDRRDLVARVIAADENPWRVGFNRLILTDTRNATMARRVASAALDWPAARVVAFGGRLHMMNSGRYLYDSPTRRPIGARLLDLGVSRSKFSSIWLFSGEDPADGAWIGPGIVSTAASAGAVPLALLSPSAIFGATSFRDIVDYGVNLGPGTPVPRTDG